MSRLLDRQHQEAIPATAEELTPAWVAAAMGSVGALAAGETVDAIRVEHLSYGGVGLSGDTVRVFLDGDLGEQAPTSLIAKFPTAVTANRGMIEAFDGYAREIAFYRDLATEVPVRVPAHCGSAMDPGRFHRATAFGGRVVNRLPARAHLALTADITKFMRPTNRRYVLLLEDMGAETTVHDLEDPPSVDQLCEIVVSLAALHTSMWGRHDLAAHPATRRLVTDIPRVFVNVLQGRSRPMAEQRWSDWLTASDRAHLDKATATFAEDVDVINEPMTFLHGDPRSDNILFGPSGLVFLDWAMTAVAHPGFDVAYLLGSSLRREDVHHISQITDVYLEAAAAGGVRIEQGELRRGMAAATRAGLVLQMNSIVVLEGGYGDLMPADLWLPRLLALVDALG